MYLAYNISQNAERREVSYTVIRSSESTKQTLCVKTQMNTFPFFILSGIEPFQHLLGDKLQYSFRPFYKIATFCKQEFDTSPYSQLYKSGMKKLRFVLVSQLTAGISRTQLCIYGTHRDTHELINCCHDVFFFANHYYQSYSSTLKTQCYQT